jgi:hypothetical protein
MNVKEITTIVVSCKHPGCSYKAHVPAEHIGFFMNNNQSCPVCRGWLWPTSQWGENSQFLQLQDALRRIRDLETVGIEFLELSVAAV